MTFIVVSDLLLRVDGEDKTNEPLTKNRRPLPSVLVLCSGCLLGGAADNSYHILFFAPWFPDAAANPEVAKDYIKLWNEKGYDNAGLSDGFRDYDAITVIAAAIEKAGKANPTAVRDALWNVDVKGVNGNIKFDKVGEGDTASGQSAPNVYVIEIKDGKLALPQLQYS